MTLDDFEKIAERSRDRFRLETLPTYLVPQEADEFARWKAGDRTLLTGTDWHRNIRDTTAAGARWSRVRVLDYPLTEYSRYELHGYQGNALFGEHINVADRAWSLELGGLREDFWQFDYSTVRMVYDAAGHFLYPELVDDPDEVSRLRAVRAIAEHHAVPLTEFLTNYEPGLIA